MKTSLEPLNLSMETASSFLGISRTMLYQMQADGRLGPTVQKIGRRSLLNRKELECWNNCGMPPREKWQKIKGASQ